MGNGARAALEHPDLRPVLCDLDPDDFAGSSVALEKAIALGEPESELGFRRGVVYVRRMHKLADWPGLSRDTSDRPGADVAARLEIDRPGNLESLHFRHEDRKPPGPGEVTIRVHAVALNFKDVLKAMGVLSERIVEGTMSGESLGLECSGVIAEVGRGVTAFRVGDEVAAFAPGCFRTLLTIPVSHAFPKLKHFSFEQEAALPVVFLTAYYGLRESRASREENAC